MTEAEPRPVMNPDWWRPKRCTCSVWAIRQHFKCGGVAVLDNNPYMKAPMFRCYWSPDGGGTWWAYEPLNPKRPGRHPKWRIWLHSIWFRGEPRLQKRPPLSLRGMTGD